MTVVMGSEEPFFTSAQAPAGGSSSNGSEYKKQQTILLPTIGIVFLTINSITALNQSKDVWTVMFIVAAYANVLLLVFCMLYMQKTPEMKRPLRMKAAVWALASTLTVLFTYRIAMMMPLFLAIFAWLMACVTVFGGFYALLVHREGPDLFNKVGDGKA